VVIVDNVTSKNEEGSNEVIVKAAEGIERDIRDLLRRLVCSGYLICITRRSLIANLCYYSTLRKINEELDKITAQGPWLLGMYSDLNASAVDGCLDRLSTSLEKFKLANDLRDSDLLQKLHARLEKIQNLTQHVANKVDDVHEDVKDMKQILVETLQSAALRSSDTVVQQIPLNQGSSMGVMTLSKRSPSCL